MGKPWGASHQQRPLAEAAGRAKISPAPTFHILRHTHASLLAVRGVLMCVRKRRFHFAKFMPLQNGRRANAEFSHY